MKTKNESETKSKKKEKKRKEKNNDKYYKFIKIPTYEERSLTDSVTYLLTKRPLVQNSKIEGPPQAQLLAF